MQYFYLHLVLCVLQKIKQNKDKKIKINKLFKQMIS